MAPSKWAVELCKALHRNDPSITCVEFQWTTNPDDFLLLGHALAHNTHCRGLLLENLLLNEETAEALENGMESSQLRSLQIQDQIVEIPETVRGMLRRTFFRGVQHSSTLSELTLSNMDVDDLDGVGEVIRYSTSLKTLCLDQLIFTKTKSTKQLVKALLSASPTLTCLHIKRHLHEEPPHRTERFLPLLYEGISCCPTIRELILERIPCRQLGRWREIILAMPAASLESLTVCEFDDNPSEFDDLNDDEDDEHEHEHEHTVIHTLNAAQEAEQYALLLMEALRRPTLSTLNVYNGIILGGLEVMPRLGHALQHNTTLATLKLDNLHLHDRDLALLMDHWGANASVKTLSFRCNVFGQDGAQRLMRWVVEHPTLQSLDLSCNVIRVEGIRRIAMELPNLSPQLTRLNLSHCAETLLFADGDEARIQASNAFAAASYQAGVALLQGIQSNFHLQSLLLQGVFVTQPLEREIQFYRGLNVTGRRLLSMNHGLATTVWCHILARGIKQFPEFQASILYYFLSEQPALVPRSDETAKRNRKLLESRSTTRDHLEENTFRSCGCRIM